MNPKEIIGELKSICANQVTLMDTCNGCPLHDICVMYFNEAPQDWEEEEEDPATYEFEPGRVYWDEMAANP